MTVCASRSRNENGRPLRACITGRVCDLQHGRVNGYLVAKYATKSSSAGYSDSSDEPVRFDSSGRVQVYIQLENTDADTLQELRELGADIEIANSDVNVVRAWVHAAALNDIAALDAVGEITAPDYGQTKVGRVTTEGTGIHRAVLVRAFSGLTGEDVKAGAISDGVDSWTSARSRRDLPSSIEIDSAPAMAGFNTISTLNLTANPLVALMINVTRGQMFRGQELFPGWNHVLIR